MSADGDSDSGRSSTSNRPGRVSLDSLDGAKDKAAVNGVHTNGKQTDDADLSPTERLERELQKAKDEKDALEEQYNTLLGKVSDMKARLNAKFKLDAVCNAIASALIWGFTEDCSI